MTDACADVEFRDALLAADMIATEPVSKSESNPPPAGKEYTIDDLAAKTRIPSRTIRFYQSEGALPRPAIRGRVAFYTDGHVERLEQIAMLQDRGLQIKAIRDVLEQAEKGEFSLAEWVGSHDQLATPWAGDRPKVMTDTELQAAVADRRPGLVGELARIGAIEKRGDAWLVESPALFDLALRLERVGVPLDVMRDAIALFQKHLKKLADELTTFFLKSADALGEDVSAAYDELRPVSMEAVRIVFGREMERSARKANESGAAAALTRKKNGKKKR
jgi:DNA-binding transcriptional MerR regulator